MADQELMAKWAKITEPREALSEMIKHSQFIGSDPYYRHLDAALWEMAERCLRASETQQTAPGATVHEQIEGTEWTAAITDGAPFVEFFDADGDSVFSALASVATTPAAQKTLADVYSSGFSAGKRAGETCTQYAIRRALGL